MENKKEPLMSAEEWYDSETKQGYCFIDMFDFAYLYSDYAVEWHLNNAKEFVEVELFPKFSNKLYGIIIPKEEPKQETLEEAIERLYYTKGLESLAQANNMTFNGSILDELFNKFKKK